LSSFYVCNLEGFHFSAMTTQFHWSNETYTKCIAEFPCFNTWLFPVGLSGDWWGGGRGGVGWPTCTANLLLVSEIMRFWVKIGSVSWRLYARGAIAMSSLWVYYYEAFVCNREVPIFGQTLKEKRTIWNCQVFMSVTWKVFTFQRWPHNFIGAMKHIQNALQNSHVSTLDFSLWDCQVIGGVGGGGGWVGQHAQQICF
jgi:hypothetical protein